MNTGLAIRGGFLALPGWLLAYTFFRYITLPWEHLAITLPMCLLAMKMISGY